MRLRSILCCVAVAITAGSIHANVANAAPRPLELEEVLRSVEASYPLLLAAEAERRETVGGLRSARGSFDTRVRADADLRPQGFYENYSGGALVEQPTRLWGARFFAGYRVGRGDFASYDGARQTNDGGEIRGGIEVPLVRGGPIDPARAELEQAELDRLRIEPEIELQRIEFLRQASLAYWDWLSSQLGVGVEQRLLDAAVDRQEQIAGRVARGALPRIDLSDNERLILERRIRVRDAGRDAEQAAIDLSLFLRDRAGEPVVVDPVRLPPGFPPEDEPSQEQLRMDIDRATGQHPLLRVLGLRIERTRIDLELARNDRLPAIDLRVEGSRDSGSGVPGISSEGNISSDPRGETEVRAVLRFELPVQRRKALGRIDASRARLTRLEKQQSYASDRIVAGIRRAMAGLEAAFAQTQAARRNLQLARELQRAEERKLMLGTSNLINVSIREAQAEYFRALAEYRAAVAVVL